MGDLLVIVNKGFNSIAINIDNISHIEETENGCIVYLNDGNSINIEDHSFNEVIGIFHSPYPYDSDKGVYIQKNMVN